jgi:hypothetical protein
MRVMSTSTTVVNCAEIFSESTMRSAMTRRRRESFSVLPRSAGAIGAVGAVAVCTGEVGAAGALGVVGMDGDWGAPGAGAGVDTGRGKVASEVMMSSRVMRPPRPVPVIVLKSTLFSRAILRTRGDV